MAAVTKSFSSSYWSLDSVSFSSSYGAVAERADASFSSLYLAVDPEHTGFTSNYTMVSVGSASFSTTYSVLDSTPVKTGFSSPYVDLAEYATNIQVVPKTLVLIGSEEVDPTSTDLSITESGAGYTCALALAFAPSYTRKDTLIRVFIGDEEYQFLLDSVKREQSGTSAPTYTVRGISRVLAYGSPRAKGIDKTWSTPTMASAIVAELLGSVDWQMVDWVIPEYRLAVKGQTPLQIAESVVKAAGGIITSDKVGNPIAQYLYPDTTTSYPTAPVVAEFYDIKDIETISEVTSPEDGTNYVLVADITSTEASLYEDIMESDVISTSIATILVYPSPVRPVRLTHTAKEALQLTAKSSNAASSREEDIEIFAGRGKTRYPIDSIISMDYISLPVAGVGYTQGSNVLATDNVNSNGIVRITYNTIASEYRVEGVTSDKVQFLLSEA